MATAAKPGAGTAVKTDAPPVKSNKKWIIIIALILLINGGVTAYLLLKPHSPASDGAENAAQTAAAETKPPKYIALGTFTANLIHEDSDRYLQVAISIKVSKPQLEEQIKARNPEILHHVNMLLESQRPSQLATLQGKEQLARSIKAQIEEVLDLRSNAPAKPSTNESQQTKSGIEEVLFTSFIIQ